MEVCERLCIFAPRCKYDLQIITENTMDVPRFGIMLLDDARVFLKSLDMETKQEIAADLKAATLTVNSNLFKKLQGTEIWEFRSKVNGLQYRLLAYWDKNRKSLVVATHAFVKKTQQTPLQEIKRAEKIMKKYYNQNI